MNLLKLASRVEQLVAATDGTTLRVESRRCVHDWNKDSACQICTNICPTRALAVTNGEITLDASACVQCGACLPTCPTGALVGFDERARLLQSLSELPSSPAVDLACGAAPTALAAPTSAVVLQIGGCLAGLGPAAYAGLAALGVERVGIHLEGCATCPIGELRSRIAATVDAVRTLIDLDVVVVTAQDGERSHKPMHATRAPRYSRRSLLRRFAGGGAPAASVLSELNPLPTDGKRPPLERRALLRALAHLRPEQRTSAHYFPAMTASAVCTACRVCANVCPTGALAFATAEGRFSLAFTPTSCTECGLCVELCTVDALQFVAPLVYDEAAPSVLLQGELKSCKRCRTAFSGEGDLCPTCAFRRKHPAGSMLRAPGASADNIPGTPHGGPG
jgi:formate hydrogenlyase subunit 6/NADH:ubiquinone oxidoreductase subunit I